MGQARIYSRLVDGMLCQQTRYYHCDVSVRDWRNTPVGPTNRVKESVAAVWEIEKALGEVVRDRRNGNTDSRHDQMGQINPRNDHSTNCGLVQYWTDPASGMTRNR